MIKKKQTHKIPLNIISPAFLSIAVFMLVFFFIVIPYFESSMLSRKKEMTKELVNSACSILEKLHLDVNEGFLDQEEAKKMAVDAIGHLRYGEELKDYFWITDMQPVMIYHPYKPELNGKDLSNYADPRGKKLFVACVKEVRQNGEGFVDYMWQWKDDTAHIVPKLSFVKNFEPWQWVLGTGIYLEDVRVEIKVLRKKLVQISLVIIVLVGSILFYIILQNLKLENKKQQALIALQRSREKYKMLVEASTEGVIMVLENRIAYVNRQVINMLRYEEAELYSKMLKDLFLNNDDPAIGKIMELETLQKKGDVVSFESFLVKKTGESICTQITVSAIVFNEQQGCLLTLKDINVPGLKDELVQHGEWFKSLANQVNIGAFRTTLGKNARIRDFNHAFLDILGYSEQDIKKLNILDLFFDKSSKKQILNQLFKSKIVKNQIVRVKAKDHSVVAVAVSLFLTDDSKDNIQYCDGIIEDVSFYLKEQQERDQLVEELQVANMFLNQSVKNLERPVVSCFLNEPVQQVVVRMAQSKTGTILIKSEQNIPIGIFTDKDLRERVIANDMDLYQPVYKVMTAPLLTISDNRMLYEAILTMKANKVKYICMVDHKEQVTGILSLEDLANAQHQSQVMLVHKIRSGKTIEELAGYKDELIPVIRALMESGMKIHHISRLISTISDEITRRVINLCIRDLGDPPAKFAFVALGSVGRKEQTLSTDQDNAIVFENVAGKDLENVQSYFLKLGKKINDWLHQIGYTYCKGGVMAGNIKWCQPLDQWKKYFTTWVEESSPQNLIDVSIFYDLRFLFGEEEIAKSLLHHVSEIENNRPVFLYHMTQTVNAIKPPLSFFGNFIVESGEEHKSTFDIKKVIIIITGFIRTYALANRISATNTLDRLHQLTEKGIFSDDDKKGILHAYSYLMNLRIQHQIQEIQKGNVPDNYINPKGISDIERSFLKKIFVQLSDFQSKLTFDFKGTL